MLRLNEEYDEGNTSASHLLQDSSSLQDFDAGCDESDVLSPPMDSDASANDNFKVVIRVRPPVPRELEGPRPFLNVVRIPTDHRSITLCEHLDTDDGRSGVYSTQSFSFDYVYDAATKQREVYERSAQPAVLSVLQGYNATVIAYGQTGTGKTFTMEGFATTSDDRRGIIPRAVEEIFSYIHSCRKSKMRFLVRASYMQIYNEVISDLLKPLGKQLSVRHTKQRGVHIEGLSEWVVRSPNDVYGLVERGRSLRATGFTKMSELSSRSHAMFIIIVEVMEGDEDSPTSYKFGKLNIVDLAGSEKVRQTGVTGMRLEETKNINWSLHELGNVISALTTRRRDKHIPFRNSCLTSALRDSLGGNCKTTLIACISPALESYSESLSTLKFANRAKNIKNEAVVNEDVDQGTLLRRYEKELKRLRQLLQGRDGSVASTGAVAAGSGMDYGVISELELGKRRAEEDREAALEALQESSRAHHEELITRKRLEGRISELESIVSGGHAGGMLGPSGIIETGMNSEDYASRLDELDKERQVMEEDKAQVDRYKQLLLKQRDIMLNLTTRLNERDETILQLQEEIDAYDAHIQMLEEAMEASQPGTSVSSSALSRAEATEYLASVTVRDRSGTVRYRSDTRDDSGPTSPSLLTAEEKLLELVMRGGVVGAAGSRPRTGGIGATSVGGSDSQQQTKHDDNLRALELMLRERVEAVAQHSAADRIQKLHRDADLLKAKLLSSEDKRRSLEYLVEMAKQQPTLSDALGRAKRYLDAEQDALRSSYTARVQVLQSELDAEREERKRLARDVDRYRFDVSQLRNSVDPTKRADLDRMWRAMAQTEEALLGELASGSPLTPPSSPSSSYVDPTRGVRDATTGGAATAAAAAAKIKSLEKALEEAKQQQQQQQQEFVAQLQDRDRVVRKLESEVEAVANKDKEIASLSKSLSTHIKDRRALKTIMESRIKIKVDNISELFQLVGMTTGTTAAPPSTTTPASQADRQRLASEIRALQNLVNASITAMDS